MSINTLLVRFQQGLKINICHSIRLHKQEIASHKTPRIQVGQGLIHVNALFQGDNLNIHSNWPWSILFDTNMYQVLDYFIFLFAKDEYIFEAVSIELC